MAKLWFIERFDDGTGILLFPFGMAILMQISQENAGVVTHFKHAEAGEQDHELLALKANQRYRYLHGIAIERRTHRMAPG